MTIIFLLLKTVLEQKTIKIDLRSKKIKKNYFFFFLI